MFGDFRYRPAVGCGFEFPLLFGESCNRLPETRREWLAGSSKPLHARRMRALQTPERPQFERCRTKQERALDIGQPQTSIAVSFDFPRKELETQWRNYNVDLLKPSAAIGDPPGDVRDRNGCPQCPPEWQYDIGEDAEHGEGGPEDLALHILNSSSFPPLVIRASRFASKLRLRNVGTMA